MTPLVVCWPGLLLAELLYDAPGWHTLAQRPALLTATLALAAGAAGVAIACGWRERAASRRVWPLLLALRLAAIAAAAGVVLGLERRELTEREELSRVVILLDRSASMGMPADLDPDAPSRNAVAEQAVRTVAQRLGERHRIQVGGFDSVVEYVDGPSTDDTPVGESTRLGAAIDRVLRDYASAPLSAIVIASDGGWNTGPDPAEVAAAAADRWVRVHTLGLGPLQRLPNLALRDLSGPSRAAAGDPFRVSLTVAGVAIDANRATPIEVRVIARATDGEEPVGSAVFETVIDVRLDSDTGVGVASVEIDPLEVGRYQIAAEILVAGADADPSDNGRTIRVELVEEPTRVLLAAGGPGRDYRFLRNQLHRDELFTLDVFLQSAVGAVTQDADRVLEALPSSGDEFEGYDAVVGIDLDWRDVDEAVTTALAEWVSSRGGGLVLFGGSVGTPVSVRAGMPEPLRAVLPVRLRDDPLAMSSMAAAGKDAVPLRLTAAGDAAAFLAAPANESASTPSGWDAFDGFYSRGLPAEPKAGATVLIQQGRAGAAESAPAIVEQLYGAGRSVYVATAETWRLRKVEPAWFTSLHTGLLRRVTQGRLRGADAEGALLWDQPRYDLGQPMRLRYIRRSPRSAVGAPFARLRLNDGSPEEARLGAVEGQPNVFLATLPAAVAGRYVATLATASGAELRAETEAALPSLENTLTQDASLLRGVADATGGLYLDASRREDLDGEALQSIDDATPVRTETTTELGPPDERFAEDVARACFAVMTVCLLLEWSLRRLWRLA